MPLTYRELMDEMHHVAEIHAKRCVQRVRVTSDAIPHSMAVMPMTDERAAASGYAPGTLELVMHHDDWRDAKKTMPFVGAPAARADEPGWKLIGLPVVIDDEPEHR